eukprot:scaffold32308_cov21-Phaeocystis_antarctica.AAC.1
MKEIWGASNRNSGRGQCTRRDLRLVLEVRRDRDEERRLAELAVHGQRVGASRVRGRVRVRVRAR